MADLIYRSHLETNCRKECLTWQYMTEDSKIDVESTMEFMFEQSISNKESTKYLDTSTLQVYDNLSPNVTARYVVRGDCRG